MVLLSLGRQGHHRDGDVLAAFKRYLVLQRELIDGVDIVAEEADDPLERANVRLAIDGFLIVLNKSILPVEGLLQSTF